MISKIKTDILSDEEMKALNFNDGAHYAVRFTNKSGGALYVTIAEKKERKDFDEHLFISSRSIDFKLYDVNVEKFSEYSVNVPENRGYGTPEVPFADVLHIAAAEVSGPDGKIIKKAASAVEKSVRDRERAGDNKKGNAKRDYAYKIVRDFLSR